MKVRLIGTRTAMRCRYLVDMYQNLNLKFFAKLFARCFGVNGVQIVVRKRNHTKADRQ